MQDLSLSAANTYFGEAAHVLSAAWAAATDNQKTAALTMATRQVTRAIGQAVAEMEDSTSVKPAWSVFEQAVWLIMNSLSVPDGTKSGPAWATVDPSSGEARDVPQLGDSGLCAESEAWISGAMRPAIILSRG